MKKFLALLLVAMLAVCSMAIAEAPEGYPEVVPGIDFGGATVYIYDYWTASDARSTEPSEEQQAQYDYRDWIMSTYNVDIHQIAKGDWGTQVEELINFCSAPDGTLCLFILPPDFVGTPMANDLFAAIDYDMTGDKWNQGTINFMTKNGAVYGTATGATEPRQCLFFNKRVLEDAGIDWETIYDMQAEGTWTWDALEEIMKAVQKDIDNDGIIDIYGMTGNNSSLYLISVFSNTGSFFDWDENGNLAISSNSDETLEALSWAKDIWNTYGYQQPADGQWDYYKEAWTQGFCAFGVEDTYMGFNADGMWNIGMEDEWGMVAFPKGPKADSYVTMASDNVTVIPNVYDAETVKALMVIYDMWSNATPGYDDEDGWIGEKYSYTDDRAVDESYAMLREAGVFNSVVYIGSINDVLGSPLLWQLGGSDPASLIEAATPAWQALCDAFNGVAQ